LKSLKTKHRFVTLSGRFVNALSDWKEEGYDSHHGKTHILDVFGSFIMTEGTYGGCISTRMTLKGSDIASMEGEAETMKGCVAASMEAEYQAYGQSVGGGVDTNACVGNDKEKIESSRRKFQQDTQEDSYFGGELVKNVFTVTPAKAAPLFYRDKKFPFELQILSDFLILEKLHPLEMRTHAISREDLIEFQTNLNNLIIDDIEEVARQLGSAHCREQSYFVRSSDGVLELKCHDPFSEGWVKTYDKTCVAPLRNLYDEAECERSFCTVYLCGINVAEIRFEEGVCRLYEIGSHDTFATVCRPY